MVRQISDGLLAWSGTNLDTIVEAARLAVAFLPLFIAAAAIGWQQHGG